MRVSGFRAKVAGYKVFFWEGGGGGGRGGGGGGLGLGW